MPQLDQVSFLSQFTWLCIFFLSFYVILVHDFLPKISTLLKIRKKKLENFQSQNSSIILVPLNTTNPSSLSSPVISKSNTTTDPEVLKGSLADSNETSGYDQIIAKSIEQSCQSLVRQVQQTSIWVNNFISKINESKLKKFNSFYLNTLGKNQVINQWTFDRFAKLAPLAPHLGSKKQSEVLSTNNPLVFKMKFFNVFTIKGKAKNIKGKKTSAKKI